MRKLLIVGLIFLLIPLTSAEIIFSQPEAIYNVGDGLANQISVHSINSATDFLIISLVCNAGEIELYRNTLSINAGETKNVELITILGNSIIGNLQGNCFLKGKFNSEETQSQPFQLSREIIVNAILGGTLYSPSDSLFVSGNAIKRNGKNADGFVEASLVNNISASSTVNDGAFSLNITLPEDIAPGKHSLTIRVFEKDASGRVTNEGNLVQEFSVKTVLTRIEIILNAETIKPGNQLTYSFTAHDQAGNAIEQDALIKIHKADENIFSEELINSGQEKQLFIEQNFTPGYWKIEIKAEEVSAKKLFYVEELEDAVFELINNTFIIRNIGNVPYIKVLEIKIGDYSILKEVKIPVNGVKKFKIKAPDNVYDINVYDGNRSFDASGVPLTGRTIDIGEIREYNLKNWAVGLFFVILLCLVFVSNIFVKRIRNKLGRGSFIKNKPAVEAKKLPSYNLPNVPSAYMAGKKENALVVALKLSNGENEAAVQNALVQARKAGAHVYEDRDCRVMVFSQNKTDENAFIINSIKTASAILSDFKEHNSKMKNKIEFGIGINRGEIIKDSRQGQISVASVGSVVPGAKRLASYSRGDILLSDDIYKIIMGSVRAEKLADVNAWKVKDLIDRTKHDSFIKGFLKRYEQEKPKE